MKISSPAFNDNSSIPSKYTCDGANVSPPLKISDVPRGAMSLALIVEDPDAPRANFTHWVVYNIPPATSEIKENELPSGAAQGMADFGAIEYGGPCPPSGIHHYIFTLYAVDADLNLSPGATKADLRSKMEGHILATGILTGLYSKK